MFGRLGWMEILIIVVLVMILFGSNKIPGMMKNLAGGLNAFKKELKAEEGTAPAKQAAKKSSAKQSAAKRAAPKKTVKK